MAQIIRSSKDNSLKIFKGFHNSENKDTTYCQIDSSNFSVINENKKVVGIKAENYFEDIEIATYYAENEIKKVFHHNKISTLYIGSPIEFSEYDDNFYLNVGNVRPDFLVKLPQIGTVFIDIKCRKLNKLNKISYFDIDKKSIKSLKNIQEELGFPIWVLLKDIMNLTARKENIYQILFTSHLLIY